MPISRRTKWVIWALVAPIAYGVSCFAYGFFRAWHKFVSEERICGAFNPVITPPVLNRSAHGLPRHAVSAATLGGLVQTFPPTLKEGVSKFAGSVSGREGFEKKIRFRF